MKNKYEEFHKKVLEDIDLGKRISPLKGIRAFCLECLGYKAEEVAECSANNWKDTRCPLYKFRLGRNETGGKEYYPPQSPDEPPNGVEKENPTLSDRIIKK